MPSDGDWPGAAAMRRALPRRRDDGRPRHGPMSPTFSVSRSPRSGSRPKGAASPTGTSSRCSKPGRAIRSRCGRYGPPSRTSSAWAGSRMWCAGEHGRGAGGAGLRADADAPDPEDHVQRDLRGLRRQRRRAPPCAGRTLRRVAASRSRGGDGGVCRGAAAGARLPSGGRDGTGRARACARTRQPGVQRDAWCSNPRRRDRGVGAARNRDRQRAARARSVARRLV